MMTTTTFSASFYGTKRGYLKDSACKTLFWLRKHTLHLSCSMWPLTWQAQATALALANGGVKGWLFVWHHWHNNITDFDQKCQNYEVLPSSQFSKPWRKCSISVFSYLAMLWSQLPFRWVVSHSEECPEYTDSAQGGRTSRQLEQIVQVRTKAMGWLNVLIWWYTFSVKLYIPQIRAKCCSSQTHVPEQGRCISFSSERFLMGTPLGRTGWDVWRPPETHIRYLPPL